MAVEKSKQGTRREKRHHVLAGENLLVYIANLLTPNERFGSDQIPLSEYRRRREAGEPIPGDIPQEERNNFFRTLRQETSEIWPGLWEPVDENEETERTEERALAEVLRMQEYLRLFWKASDKRDERAQDWYIHRAREYYQRRFVLSKTKDARRIANNARNPEQALDAASRLNIEIERELDEPPQSNPFEDALFGLQERAKYPSRRPLCCLNGVNCERRNATKALPEGPYFLSDKKGRHYCSNECSHEANKASKRKYYHDHN